jgi:hypothetical protein
MPKLARPLLTRPSHGSIFGARTLPTTWPKRERADLFKARATAEGLRVGST